MMISAKSYPHLFELLLSEFERMHECMNDPAICWPGQSNDLDFWVNPMRGSEGNPLIECLWVNRSNFEPNPSRNWHYKAITFSRDHDPRAFVFELINWCKDNAPLPERPKSFFDRVQIISC